MLFDGVHASRSESPDGSETPSITPSLFQESHLVVEQRSALGDELKNRELQLRKRDKENTQSDHSVEQGTKRYRGVNSPAGHPTMSTWLAFFDPSESKPTYPIPLWIGHRNLQIQKLKQAMEEGNEEGKETLLQQIFTPDELSSACIEGRGEIVSSYINMRQSQIEVLQKALKDFKERILTALLQQEEINFSDETAMIKLKLEQQEAYIAHLVDDLHHLEIETEASEATPVFCVDDHDMTAASTSENPVLDDNDNLATSFHIFQIQVLMESYEECKERLLQKLLNQEEVFLDEKIELEHLKSQIAHLESQLN